MNAHDIRRSIHTILDSYAEQLATVPDEFLAERRARATARADQPAQPAPTPSAPSVPTVADEPVLEPEPATLDNDYLV